MAKVKQAVIVKTTKTKRKIPKGTPSGSSKSSTTCPLCGAKITKHK